MDKLFLFRSLLVLLRLLFAVAGEAASTVASTLAMHVELSFGPVCRIGFVLECILKYGSFGGASKAVGKRKRGLDGAVCFACQAFLEVAGTRLERILFPFPSPGGFHLGANC